MDGLVWFGCWVKELCCGVELQIQKKIFNEIRKVFHFSFTFLMPLQFFLSLLVLFHHLHLSTPPAVVVILCYISVIMIIFVYFILLLPLFCFLFSFVTFSLFYCCYYCCCKCPLKWAFSSRFLFWNYSW